MRVTLARTLLLLAGVANLLLALSLPAPKNATLGQQATQVAFVMGMVLCAVAFVQLRRRPDSGRRLTLAGGVLGLLMILWKGRPLLALIREGGGAQAFSALIPLASWTALVLAAGFVLGEADLRETA